MDKIPGLKKIISIKEVIGVSKGTEVAHGKIHKSLYHGG